MYVMTQKRSQMLEKKNNAKRRSRTYGKKTSTKVP